MAILNPRSMITQAVASQVTALRLKYRSGAHRSCGVGHVGSGNTSLVGVGALVRPNGGSHRRTAA